MQLSETEWSLLELLSWQPWLSAEQMMCWQGRALSRVLADLKRLLTLELVQRESAQRLDFNPRRVRFDRLWGQGFSRA